MDYGRLVIWSFLFLYFGFKFIKNKGFENLFFSLSGLYGLTSVNFILTKDKSLEVTRFLDTPIMMVINIGITIALVVVALKFLKKEFIVKN